MRPNQNLIIDFTFVEPTAQTYVGTYNKAGQAALKGKENKINKEYKHWKVVGDQVTNNFKVIAIETFGVLIKDDIISTIDPFINAKENRAMVINLVLQQLSVAFHTVRAKQHNFIKNTHVLRELPLHPLRNRGQALYRQG
jgi:hypothetical protein